MFSFYCVQRQIDHRKSVTFQLGGKVHFFTDDLAIAGGVICAKFAHHLWKYTKYSTHLSIQWTLEFTYAGMPHSTQRLFLAKGPEQSESNISRTSSIMFWTAFWLLFYRHSCNSDWTRFMSGRNINGRRESNYRLIFVPFVPFNFWMGTIYQSESCDTSENAQDLLSPRGHHFRSNDMIPFAPYKWSREKLLYIPIKKFVAR